MALYREGKAAMAADGTVTGTGTKWQSSLSLIRPGATIMFLSSPIQMAVVNKVVSDTEIKAITTNGAVVASTDYAILLSDSLTVDGLAQDVAETLRYYQSQETEIADAVDFFKTFDFESLQILADQVRADSEAADASAAAAGASAADAMESKDAAKTSEINSKASEVAAQTAKDQVQQIINDAGDQSTLVTLSQPTGPTKIGWGETDLSYFISQSANLFEFMTFAEIADANSTSPMLDHSQAFIEASATGKPIFVPSVKGYYNAGDVSLPNNTTIWGLGAKTYTNTTDAGMVGKGSSIRLKPGATSIFKLRLYFNIYGINFWGVDKTRDLIARRDSGQDPQRGRFVGCGIHGFRVGVGMNSNYCKEIEVIDCNIANNVDGTKNLVDSKITGGYINANDNRGVVQLTGANDLIINGTKIEWNNGQNVYCYQAKNIVLSGCILDRSGLAGIHCQESEVDAGTSKVRRSGRLAVGTNQCTHFYCEGAGTKLIANGIDTTNGANDDGTGDNTPERFLIVGGSSPDMTIIVNGSYVMGVTNQTDPVKFVVTPARTKITGCVGMDNFVNYGLSRESNGKRSMSDKSVTIVGIASSYVTLNNGKMTTYSRQMRSVEISIRNTGADDAAVSARVDLLIIRDGGIPKIYITDVRSYPSGRFGTAGTENYVLSTSNVADDASTFDLNISVTTGTATLQFAVSMVN